MLIKIIEVLDDKQIKAIIEDDDFKVPKVGLSYFLKKYDRASYMQLRLFHPLIQEWYKSGLYPYNNINDWWTLRQTCKHLHGSGYDGYTYVNNLLQMIDCSSIDSIPGYVIYDFAPIEKGGNGNSLRIRGRLKSLTKYTVKEMMSLIDNVFRAMEQSHVDTAKYQRIKRRVDWKA